MSFALIIVLSANLYTTEPKPEPKFYKVFQGKTFKGETVQFIEKVKLTKELKKVEEIKRIQSKRANQGLTFLIPLELDHPVYRCLVKNEEHFVDPYTLQDLESDS